MSRDNNSGAAIVQTQAPSWQQPYQAKGLQYAQNMLEMGPPQQYGGPTVVPFSQQTERAMRGIEERALNGSPLVGQASQYVSSQLGSSPTSQFASGVNPYLDAMYKRAADNSRSQLETEFSRAGRNVNAAAPIRGQQLNDLATQMYGGAYENQQQRALSDILSQRSQQQQALASVPYLSDAPYRDMERLASVGTNVENLAGRYQQDYQRRFDYEQQAPQLALDAYMRRVGNNMGQSTYEPQGGSNQNAAALAGALLGGQLGSQLGNGSNWATILGALGGGLLGRRG